MRLEEPTEIDRFTICPFQSKAKVSWNKHQTTLSFLFSNLTLFVVVFFAVNCVVLFNLSVVTVPVDVVVFDGVGDKKL